jgi:hypothetical protein
MCWHIQQATSPVSAKRSASYEQWFANLLGEGSGSLVLLIFVPNFTQPDNQLPDYYSNKYAC